MGTNLGDRQANLQAAIRSLRPEVLPELCSPIYETPPWGFEEQPAFLNQVVRAKTDLSPQDLLHHIQNLEKKLGRRKSFRNGPRLIDIDILFYDDLVMDTPQLGLPHPRMEGRAFVWVPLADIAPDLVHPTLGKSISQVRLEMDTTGITVFADGSCV